MGAFLDSLDIANRALTHLGLPAILDVDEDSLRNTTISAAYDKMREAELERNVWNFAKKKVVLRPVTATSRLIAPRAWVSTETYLPGAIVADDNGDLWISWLADNLNNEPGVSSAWDGYFGPAAIDVYDSTVSYYAGELVYKATSGVKGGFAIFMSSTASNTAAPDTGTAWSATATYGLNDRVLSGGYMWRSLITLNLNITPAVPPNDWFAAGTYSIANTAVGSDGFIYTSVINGNIDHDPVGDNGTKWTKGDAAAWSRDPEPYTSAGTWLPIFSDMTNMPGDATYVGQTSVTGVKNVFRAPNGGLRQARLGYRNRLLPNDYEPHGDYITSGDAIILVEFVANVRDVTKMHSMFCEGLAIRIALATCKKLTGSENAIATLASEYNKFMNEARTINAIEAGPEEPDEDEYITTRRGGNGGFSDASTFWWN